MQLAILIISSVGAVTSAGSLAVGLKLALELKAAKTEVDDFKAKTDRNVAVIKTALSQLEF